MIIVSKDKTKLDVHLIHEFISNSYWGKGRTIVQVTNAIENSICFGVYEKEQQVGFARVVSDHTFFAFLMDVFILPECRGKGYSKQLMEFMLKDENLKDCKTWMLKTADAHGLYEQYEFTGLTAPEKVMERIKMN